MISYAQESNIIYSVENFFINEGLPVIRIYDINQDHQGLIWICTETGLYSFNGTDFEIQVDFGKINYYPNKLLFDNNQNLWLLKHKFLTSSEIRKDLSDLKVFSKELNEINLSSYINDSIKKSNNIYQSEDGNIICHLGQKIYEFDTILREIKLPIESNNFIHKNKDYIIVNDTSDAIILSRKSGQEVYRYKEKLLTKAIETGEDLLLQFSTGETTFFNEKRKNEKIQFNSISNSPFFSQTKDDNNIIWSISLREIKKYNLQSRSVVDFNKHNLFKSDSYFTSIFKDRQNIIWIGSNQGLYKIRAKKNNLFFSPKAIHHSTRAILPLFKNQFFISTYNGDYLYNLEKDSSKRISDTNIKYSAIKNETHYFTINKFHHLQKVKINNHELDSEIKIELEKADLSNPGVILKNKTNKHLLKLANNILSFDDNLNTTIIYQDDNCQFRNIQKIDDKFFLSTTQGVKIFNEHFELEKTFLEKYIIKLVHRDLVFPDLLWLSTPSFLIRLNTKTSETKFYDRKYGFINSNFTSIKEDNYGKLWLSSYAGLYRFDKNTEEIKAYLVEDGITNNEFNNYSSIVMDDGRFVFGGISGITIVNTEEKEEENIQISNIEIYECQKISAKEKVDITKSVNKSRQIKIYEKDVVTNFKFAHLSFDNLKSKVYQYRILDLKEKDTIVPWLNLYSNELQLGKMPYGKYSLEFQAISRLGVRLSNINRIELIYLQPYMKTNLFRLLSVLFLIGFVYFIIHIRSQSLMQQKLELEKEVSLRTLQIIKQKEELEQINSTKDKLFSILAHDLKSPLITLKNISGKINYLINKNQPDRILDIGKTIEDKVSNLNIFLDNLLNWSLQQRGHISYNPETISINNIIHDVLNIYDDRIKEKNLNINTNISKEASCYADRNSMHSVMRNIISNAIKYSPINEHILIEFEPGSTYNVVSVKDQGKGINQKTIDSLYKNEKIKSEKGTNGEKGTGLGLSITKELIELNKGHIKFLTNTKGGTIVQIHLPSKS